MTDPYAIYAIAAPGLEPLVAEELAALPGAHAVQVAPGGVSVRGDAALLYRMNLELRCATRVLLRLGQFRARDFAALCREISRLPLDDVARAVGGPRHISVRAAAHRSRLYHTGAIVERVQNTLGERGLHTADPAAPPGVSLYLRAEDDLFTVSVDSSGELLHQRGFRIEGGEAPLRETLAAALLRLCGYAGSDGEPLCDPTCGSGTLAIEAALSAVGRAPGLLRGFAFQTWPSYRERLFRTILDDARRRERPVRSGLITAGDLSEEALSRARRNAERAGVAELINFECRDVANARLPDGRPGLVLCNPPYGKRIGEGRLRPLYRAIGQLVRSRPGWRLGLICPATNPTLARAAGRDLTTLALDNGGLRILLCRSKTLPPSVRPGYALNRPMPVFEKPDEERS